MVQDSLSKKQDLISKITRVKKAGGMVQAVEHLTPKHEALSPNSRTTKKRIFKNNLFPLPFSLPL
jgi:hypothetical protein